MCQCNHNPLYFTHIISSGRVLHTIFLGICLRIKQQGTATSPLHTEMAWEVGRLRVANLLTSTSSLLVIRVGAASTRLLCRSFQQQLRLMGTHPFEMVVWPTPWCWVSLYSNSSSTCSHRWASLGASLRVSCCDILTCWVIFWPIVWVGISKTSNLMWSSWLLAFFGSLINLTASEFSRPFYCCQLDFFWIEDLCKNSFVSLQISE